MGGSSLVRLVGLVSGWVGGCPLPSIPGSLVPNGWDYWLGVAVQSCSGLVSGEFWACSDLDGGLGLVWGSFRLGKGLMSRLLLGVLG